MIEAVRRRLSQLSPAIVERLNTASLFSSTGFAKLWRAQGGREVFWVCEQDGKVVAVMPAVEFGVKPVRRLQVMPDGCHSEIVPVNDHHVNRSALARAFWQAIVKEQYFRVHLTDYTGDFADIRQAERLEGITLVVELSSSEWEPPDKKIRSEIRKAGREQIMVAKFDQKSHIPEFLTLMEATERRHGRKPKYSERFYVALAALAEKDDRIDWTVAYHEDKLAASHINLILNDELLNWQVYFDKMYSFLKPNQFMLHRAAIRSFERGVRFLNLGVTPSDAESLAEYKRKWGGVERRYYHYKSESRLGRLL